MSWDLIAHRRVVDQNGNAKEPPVGEFTAVKQWVSEQLDVEWLGPFWCGLAGEGFSIEINVGSFDSKAGDPIDSLGFEVRGSGDALTVIAEFCQRNQLVLHDLATGAEIDLDDPSDVGGRAAEEHREASLERALERHGDSVPAPTAEPGSLAEAKELAKNSGYLRDQPIEHMEYVPEESGNNFVIWNDRLLFTGHVRPEIAAGFQTDLETKGFFRVPDESVRAAGPPLWFENLTRIEKDQSRPCIRVRGRDTSRVRRSYPILFADDGRRDAFLEVLLARIDRPHTTLEGVARPLSSLLAIPFVFAALVSGLGYAFLERATANAVAMGVGGLFLALSLRTALGKPAQWDHFVYSEED